ncbi:hypothetical protein ATCV1_z756R [Acanthocystis turfacea chlorella virus 1]|uniref:Uncharacterized protein z756R n=1 Tax=Chlorovirus heliozoae TaxID=322019 RepID=A7KA16_9PHYC|nr:hypothetical protein ATCV1_z756R [Acanthocystis turfacea chlorella virus 1]ABT16890.1 hypothetical protein ATCV1_z756R [Acanthocystis turfacea chlorella virus 1]
MYSNTAVPTMRAPLFWMSVGTAVRPTRCMGVRLWYSTTMRPWFGMRFRTSSRRMQLGHSLLITTSPELWVIYDEKHFFLKIFTKVNAYVHRPCNYRTGDYGSIHVLQTEGKVRERCCHRKIRTTHPRQPPAELYPAASQPVLRVRGPHPRHRHVF